MKRTLIVIAGLFALLLAISSVSSVTWLTYREDVSFTVGRADISNSTFYNGTSQTNVTVNITLPCNASQLNGVESFINISASNQSVNITYNLTANGNIVNRTSGLNESNPNVNWWHVTTLNTLRNSTNVSNTSRYINFTFNCSAPDNDANATANIIEICLVGADVNLTPQWIAANVVITEWDRATPAIETSVGSSFFTVNNSVNITNTMLSGGSFGLLLSDINLTTIYPSHKISYPDTYIRATSIANGSFQVNYTIYQKRGPYTYSIDEDITGSAHEVTILVKCEEVLTNCVDWTIVLDDDFYEGYFDTLDNASLEITLNNIDKDWERGSIEMEDLTIRAVHTLNKFVFTWTVPAVSAPSAAPAGILPGLPAATEEVLFMPFWVWITIIAVAAVGVVGAVVYIKKK